MRTPQISIAAILRFLHRYFIWLVVISYVAAAVSPEFGIWIRNLGAGGSGMPQAVSLPAIMLAILLFNAGMGMRVPELTGLFWSPFLLLGALCLNLAMPLAFLYAVSSLAYAWHNQNEVQEILAGLALVASMPIAGASRPGRKTLTEVSR